MSKRVLLIIGVCIIIGTCIMISINKDFYNPITSILISVVISLVFYSLGKREVEVDTFKIEKGLNQKWMPQAISSICRLITLRSNIQSLKSSNNNKCGEIESNFPDIEKPQNAVIKTIISTDCNHLSQRLNDIDNQIDDAINEWNRFAQANCFADDCDTIQRAIKSMEQKRLLNCKSLD